MEKLKKIFGMLGSLFFILTIVSFFVIFILTMIVPDPFAFTQYFVIFPIFMFLAIIFLCLSGGTQKPATEQYIEAYSEHIENLDKYQTSEQRSHLDLDSIPETCPQCNAPLSISDLEWKGPLTAECPYCGYVFKVKIK